MPEKIQDQTFLFAGTPIEFNRDEAEALVEANGGKVLSSISNKLNFLVVGEDAGSKLAKAKSIGTVKVITEKEFLKMVAKGKANAKQTTKKKMTNVFKPMSNLEFKKQWSDSWMDFNSYTRILLLVRSEENIKKEIEQFVEERSFLKLDFIEKTEDELFGENVFWVYLHSNSEFRYLNEDLITFSSVGKGVDIEAIDIDNRILQKYSWGDLDTGMYCDIDPEDFEADNEANQDYYDSIDDRINISPIKVV